MFRSRKGLRSRHTNISSHRKAGQRRTLARRSALHPSDMAFGRGTAACVLWSRAKDVVRRLREPLARCCRAGTCSAVSFKSPVLYCARCGCTRLCMEHGSREIADRTARLIAATERSRRRAGPSRRPKGEELEEALLLAAQFPASPRGDLEYPVLKRLIETRADRRRG